MSSNVSFSLKQVIFEIPVFRLTGDVHFHSVFGAAAAQRHDHRGTCGPPWVPVLWALPSLTSHDDRFQVMWVRKTLDVMTDLKTLQETRRRRKRKD